MTFLITIDCVMLFGIWAFIRHLRTARNRGPAYHATHMFTFLATTGIGAAFFLMLVGTKWPPQQWGTWLLLAAAIATAVGCSSIVVQTRHSGSRSHFGAASLATLFASLYLAFTAIDSLYFNWDAANTGYLDISVAADAGIHCEHGYVLVKLDTDRKSATYRCPANIVLGNPLAQPFVPWPAYREGTSVELARSIAKLHADALR